MSAATDTNEAREALYAISADIPRKDWIRVGMAAQAAGLEFKDFNDWSAQGRSYLERAARDAWRSFKPDGAIGAKTLFMVAKEHGWIPKRPATEKRAAGRARTAQEPREAKARGVDPSEVWERCKPATADHPYIERKRGVPDGLRTVPAGDPLRVMGESMAGALVVPVVRADGSIASLQLIPPPDVADRLKAAGKPAKLNLPGAQIDGWFVVGALSERATCYVCEGVGQAWAAWKATGSPGVVCFGWGRVRSVAAALRQLHSGLTLVICPDAGKESEAEQIAREVRGRFVCMPEVWPNNADINDLALRDGSDAVEALLANAIEPEQRYKLLTGADLAALPPLAWRVRGVLPASGLASVYGPSASGKSFLAFDMAAAIAEGERWFGCRVEAAPVVYVALEGEAGFRQRAAAWEAHKGRKLPTALRIVLQSFKLTEAADLQDLGAVVPAGAVLVLDTLNRAAPTSDENSSADMGAILDAAKQLQAAFSGLVLVIHHSGKDATKGLRGHSSLFAALDAAVEVSRDGDRREFRIAKSKDGSDGEAKAFRLQVETLGADEHGDAITSCVVVPDSVGDQVRRVPLPSGRNQKIVLDAIRPLFASGEVGKAGAPALAPCIKLEDAILTAGQKLPCESHRRSGRAREAITGLVSSGVVGLHEGWLWLRA